MFRLFDVVAIDATSASSLGLIWKPAGLYLHCSAASKKEEPKLLLSLSYAATSSCIAAALANFTFFSALKAL